MIPRLPFSVLALSLTVFFGGCASIVSGTMQSVSVSTSGPVDAPGAQCSLANDKGQWFVTTPGSVTVHRSYNDLVVNCLHESAGNGSFAAKSSTKGLAFGNILFGGIIGIGVDAGTGAAYDYPTSIVVAMDTATPAPLIVSPPVAEAAPAAPAKP